MQAFISLGTFTRKNEPIDFKGKLIKMIGKYSEMFGGVHEVWETDQQFTMRFNGQDVNTNTVFIYK